MHNDSSSEESKDSDLSLEIDSVDPMKPGKWWFKCPACGGSNIDMIDMSIVDDLNTPPGDFAVSTVRCLECESRWDEIYTPSHREGLELGQKIRTQP